MAAERITFPGKWKGWTAGWTPPDRRPIEQWAKEHVNLPTVYAIPGPFDYAKSRWMIEPFAAVKNDAVREVTLRAAIQVGKTLWAQICILWAIANDPGPIMWTMQTDDDAEEEAKTRFNALLDKCRAVASILPDGKDRTKRTNTAIYFGDFFLLLNGANLSNLQSKPIRWKINSELWMRQWQGLYAHAKGRVSAFEALGISKILNESQSGAPNDEIDQAFQRGDQNLWAVDCGGGHHALTYDHKHDDGSRAGVVWDRDALDENGHWNVSRACETVRYICPKSGMEKPDTDKTRAEWMDGGKYIATNPDAPETVKSYHVNALVSRPMKLLVEEHLNALNLLQKGVEEPLKEFVQKRLAIPYTPRSQEKIELQTELHGYTFADYHGGEMVNGEVARVMTIDRQKDHFWTDAAAVMPDGTSRQIYFGKVETIEQCREIQQRLNVPDRYTAEDANYDTPAVYSDCTAYGWVALHGERKKTWPHPLPVPSPATGRKEAWKFYSLPQAVSHSGRRIHRVHFSGDNFKSTLHGIIQSGRWQLPDDVSDTYRQHMAAEQYTEIRPGVWEWKRNDKQNHGWDTGVMRVVLMTAIGILQAETSDKPV